MSTGRNRFDKVVHQNTHQAIQDMNRRLHSIIRTGSIAEIDNTKGRCRVTVGGNTTNWLKWHADRSGDDSNWDPPSPNEQVTILCPSGRMEQAVVLTGLFDKSKDSPDNNQDHRHRRMKDGTEHFHDVSKSVKQMSIPDKGSHTTFIGDASIAHDKDGHTIKANSKALMVMTKDKFHAHHNGGGIEVKDGVVTIKGQFRCPQPQIIDGQDTPPSDNTPKNQIPSGGGTSTQSQLGDAGDGSGGGTSSA